MTQDSTRYQPRAVPLSGAIIAVIIAALAGFIVGKVFTGPAKRGRAPTAPSSARKVAVDVAQKAATQGNPPAMGPTTAKVAFVIFSDFQCPYCGMAAPTIRQLEKKYPNDVRFVFRQLPLPMHDKAQLAAEASMAANAQGKFWEYHDKLFANQRELDRPALERYAEQVGLDMAKFRQALDGHEYAAAVSADSALAASAQISGTPTFMINGQVVSGALPIEEFSKMIDRALRGQPIT